MQNLVVLFLKVIASIIRFVRMKCFCQFSVFISQKLEILDKMACFVFQATHLTVFLYENIITSSNYLVPPF